MENRERVAEFKAFFMNHKDKRFNFTIASYHDGYKTFTRYRGWGIWNVYPIQESDGNYWFALEIVSPKGIHKLITSGQIEHFNIVK